MTQPKASIVCRTVLRQGVLISASVIVPYFCQRTRCPFPTSCLTRRPNAPSKPLKQSGISLKWVTSISRLLGTLSPPDLYNSTKRSFISGESRRRVRMRRACPRLTNLRPLASQRVSVNDCPSSFSSVGLSRPFLALWFKPLLGDGSPPGSFRIMSAIFKNSSEVPSNSYSLILIV